tara:strand:- start:307 stop:504 length:198 start_codon:yes stop_codon:yes gene_type:complete
MTINQLIPSTVSVFSVKRDNRYYEVYYELGNVLIIMDDQKIQITDEELLSEMTKAFHSALKEQHR